MHNSEQTWTKAEVQRTAIGVLLALLAITAFLLFGVDWNIERHKAQQKLDRVHRDLSLAGATLENLRRTQGNCPPPGEGYALPEAISQHFAETRGGAPYYQEVARYLRLDLFSPGAPHSEPLIYYLDRPSGHWLLLSRGPDRDVDLGPAALQASPRPEGFPSEWMLQSHDPTNGVASSGDIWISNLLQASSAGS